MIRHFFIPVYLGQNRNSSADMSTRRASCRSRRSTLTNWGNHYGGRQRFSFFSLVLKKKEKVFSAQTKPKLHPVADTTCSSRRVYTHIPFSLETTVLITFIHFLSFSQLSLSSMCRPECQFSHRWKPTTLLLLPTNNKMKKNKTEWQQASNILKITRLSNKCSTSSIIFFSLFQVCQERSPDWYKKN